MLLSAVSVLVVVQSSSEIPEGLMNNPVYSCVLDGNTSIKKEYSYRYSFCPQNGPSLPLYSENQYSTFY
jgi:hypothetical protein